MKASSRWITRLTLMFIVVAVCSALVPAKAGGWCQDVALKVRGEPVIEKTTLCLPPCYYAGQVDLACSAKRRPR